MIKPIDFAITDRISRWPAIRPQASPSRWVFNKKVSRPLKTTVYKFTSFDMPAFYCSSHLGGRSRTQGFRSLSTGAIVQTDIFFFENPKPADRKWENKNTLDAHLAMEIRKHEGF